LSMARLARHLDDLSWYTSARTDEVFNDWKAEQQELEARNAELEAEIVVLKAKMGVPEYAQEVLAMSKSLAVAAAFDEEKPSYEYLKAKDIFDRIDTDGSGAIDGDELRTAFAQLGIEADADEVQKLLEECDTDGSGKIEENEFINIVRRVQENKEGFGTLIQAFISAADNISMFDNSKDEAIKKLPDNVLQNLAKAGGSVIMLKDNKGMIYKEMNDHEELDFYKLVHDSKENGAKPDPFLRYLHGERLIPFCKLQGFVRQLTPEECADFPPNNSGYFTQVSEARVEEGEKMVAGTKPVLIMENLIDGYENPCSCDFKLGDQAVGTYPGEPGYEVVKKLREAQDIYSYAEMNEVLSKWKVYKEGKNADGVKLKEVNHTHVGIRTPLVCKEIKLLMKTWRQMINNLESPVTDLKFRCCGMRVRPGEGAPPANFKYGEQAKEGKIDITKPHQMTTKGMSELIEDFCQGDSELAKYFILRINELILWFSNNTHYRFYASSICLFYDYNDHSKRNVRWLDFAHAHRMLHEDGTPQFERRNAGGATNESVREALSNVCDCLAPVVWSETGFVHRDEETHEALERGDMTSTMTRTGK